MNDKSQDQDAFINDLLEASLARYRSAEPHPGLETRVLARVRAEQEAVQRRTWLLAFGSVAAMVVVISAAFYVTRRRPAPASPIVSESARSPGVASATHLPPKDNSLAHPRELVTRPVLRSARKTRSVPRRPEQFPTPAPLSEEEKLLLAYFSQAPKSDLSKPIIRDPEIEPIKISELKIGLIEIQALPGPMN